MARLTRRTARNPAAGPAHRAQGPRLHGAAQNATFTAGRKDIRWKAAPSSMDFRAHDRGA